MDSAGDFDLEDGGERIVGMDVEAFVYFAGALGYGKDYGDDCV